MLLSHATANFQIWGCYGYLEFRQGDRTRGLKTERRLRRDSRLRESFTSIPDFVWNITLIQKVIYWHFDLLIIIRWSSPSISQDVFGIFEGSRSSGGGGSGLNDAAGLMVQGWLLEAPAGLVPEDVLVFVAERLASELKTTSAPLSRFVSLKLSFHQHYMHTCQWLHDSTNASIPKTTAQRQQRCFISRPIFPPSSSKKTRKLNAAAPEEKPRGGYSDSGYPI